MNNTKPTKDSLAKCILGLLAIYSVADVLGKSKKALASEIEDLLPTAVDFQYLSFYLSVDADIRYPKIQELSRTTKFYSLKLSLLCWFSVLLRITDKRSTQAYSSAERLLRDLGFGKEESDLLGKLMIPYDLCSIIRIVPDSENPLLK